MEVTELVRRVVDLPRAGVVLVLDAPQRVAALWQDVDRLVGRAASLLGRFEALTDRLEVVTTTVETEVEGVRDVVARIRAEVEAAEGVLATARVVAVEAGRTRSLAEEQVLRLQRLVDDFEAPLRALAPVVAQASRELAPRHLEGIASLLDRLPRLVERIEPALTGMAELAPGMEQVAERMDNVGQVVEGLPGAKALRRRGRAREAED